jgi:hypothetical protein
VGLVAKKSNIRRFLAFIDSRPPSKMRIEDDAPGEGSQGLESKTALARAESPEPMALRLRLLMSYLRGVSV